MIAHTLARRKDDRHARHHRQAALRLDPRAAAVIALFVPGLRARRTPALAAPAPEVLAQRASRTMTFDVRDAVRRIRLTYAASGASAVVHSVTVTPAGARSGSFGARRFG